VTAPQLLRTRRPWGLIALAAAALATAAESRAQGASQQQLAQMNEATFDSASAVTMIPRLRSILATSTDSNYTGMIRQMLLRAQLSSGAPSKALAKSADSTLAYLPRAPRNRIPFYASVAQALAERGARGR
jgi:ABC-type enterochelin transport system permease subunit